MPDFVVVAGNDYDSEVIFEWFNNLGKIGEVKDVFIVTVGKRKTIMRLCCDVSEYLGPRAPIAFDI